MSDKRLPHAVAMVQTKGTYPSFPYAEDPSLMEALQMLLEALGGVPQNPFKGKIHPGELALIKPNWVRDYNPLGHDLDSLISHSSLIHGLMEFLAKAMEGKGTIVIGDAPLQNCTFEALIEKNKMNQVAEIFKKKYPKLEVVIEDWRLTRIKHTDWKGGFMEKNIQTSTDDFGQKVSEAHRRVDMGKDSFLEDLKEITDRFRVTRYKNSLMHQHHQSGKHEYLVTKRIFEADLIINLSKMKTHIKAGLTGALKSLIGINGHKEFLPHHIKGPYFKGGDNFCRPNFFYEWYEDVYDDYWEHFAEHSRLRRNLQRHKLQALEALSRLTGGDGISAGSWRGNETVWRTTLDLNHLLYFKIPRKARTILNIVDGIVAGEGEGPLSPTPKPLGLLFGGENPAYVDAVMGKLMGYNLSRVPTVYQAIYHRRSQFAGPFLEDFKVLMGEVSNKTFKEVAFDELPNLAFKKPQFWTGA